jgi:hypothetical protein
MTLGKRMPVLLSAMLAVLVLRTAAAADSTAALVLDIQGHSVPHLEPYHEIVNLPTIQLAKKTRLTFLHYDTCRMVTVTGGTVTFGLNTYAIATGQIAQESQVDCPQRIRVVGGTTGVQLRSAAKAAVPLSPTFVIIGQRAEEFVSLRVSEGAAVVMDEPIRGRRVPWPLTIPPLTSGRAYEILLTPATSATPPVRVLSIATDTLSGAQRQPLALLSVD